LSTAALCASGKAVTSVDIAPCEPHATKLRIAYPNWTFIQGHSLEVDLPSCDLLFIDGEHTYGAVRAELMRFELTAKRWIVLHDTETFRHQGKDGSKPGLEMAILDFVNDDTDRWGYLLQLPHNNGLTILDRR